MQSLFFSAVFCCSLQIGLILCFALSILYFSPVFFKSHRESGRGKDHRGATLPTEIGRRMGWSGGVLQISENPKYGIKFSLCIREALQWIKHVSVSAMKKVAVFGFFMTYTILKEPFLDNCWCSVGHVFSLIGGCNAELNSCEMRSPLSIC